MAGSNPQLNPSASWSQIVSAMYPDILTSTHSVPPMYFNQVQYRREVVAGTGVHALVLEKPSVAGGPGPSHDLTPDSIQPMPPPPHNLWSQEPLQITPRGPKGPATVKETDVKDDTAQAQVLRNLQVLGESRKEAMFIISQLNFNEYLHDPVYAAAVAQLPQIPVNIKTGRKLDGDFDILVIHRQHGILIGELKTVGKDPKFGTDAIVSKIIEKAVKQLEKSKDVMSHLVSDVTSPGVTVRTTMFLPFVSRDQLRRVFSTNQQLLKDACRILGAADATEAAQRCCCADQLSDPEKWWQVTDDVVQELEAWWQGLMASAGPPLSDKVYLDVVARFVGPATSVTVHCNTGPRVQVKTVDQALSELGRRLTTLVLTPEQVDIMQRTGLDLVYLTGLPGTGKTVVMTLVGLRWLRSGHDVHVVSVNDTRAASILIKNQLETTLAADCTRPPGCGRVFVHHYDLRFDTDVAEKDRAVKELASFGPRLFLICDELADPGLCQFVGPGIPPLFFDLLTELRAQVPQLTVWGAGFPKKYEPPNFSVFPLTTPLRSAPAVVRVVGTAVTGMWSHVVHPYSSNGFPAAGDGPLVEELVHEKGDLNGHTGDRPEKCFLCGHNVADMLRYLGVGVPGSTTCPRDVFILSENSSSLIKFVSDGATVRPSDEDCDLIQALRDAGLVLWVMNRHVDKATQEREAGEVAEAARNEIVVTDYHKVHGMERKVVVVLGDDDWLKLYGASRATSQLVIVKTGHS